VNFLDSLKDSGMQCDLDKQLFEYSDQFSSIVYRRPVTIQGNHETDNIQLPLLAIFTKGPTSTSYNYQGVVSLSYRFVGNATLLNKSKESIQEVGFPIVNEQSVMNFRYTQFRSELTIRNSKSVSQVGDVYPTIVVDNSYDGTRAATMSFGLTLYEGSYRTSFCFNLGKMSQVHLTSAKSYINYTVTSYIDVFRENIEELIQRTFHQKLTPKQVLSVLDVVEKIGKRRRKEVSKILEEMEPATDKPLEEQDPDIPTHSAWTVFLAIVRYSSLEGNLNAKRMLENAAESLLVIPSKMYNMLKQLETASKQGTDS